MTEVKWLMKFLMSMIYMYNVHVYMYMQLYMYVDNTYVNKNAIHSLSLSLSPPPSPYTNFMQCLPVLFSHVKYYTPVSLNWDMKPTLTQLTICWLWHLFYYTGLIVDDWLCYSWKWWTMTVLHMVVEVSGWGIQCIAECYGGVPWRKLAAEPASLHKLLTLILSRFNIFT